MENSGLVEAERFIALMNSEPFVYTEWRKENLFKGMPVKELSNAAMEYRHARKATLQPKILSVTPLPNYTVMLVFDTGERKLFDVTPYISGDWFGKLGNPEFFNTVHVAGNTIEWADGQDIAPHELYDYATPIFLADSLVGLVPNDVDESEVKKERLARQ